MFTFNIAVDQNYDKNKIIKSLTDTYGKVHINWRRRDALVIFYDQTFVDSDDIITVFTNNIGATADCFCTDADDIEVDYTDYPNICGADDTVNTMKKLLQKIDTILGA